MRRTERRRQTNWTHRPTLDNLCASIVYYAQRHPDDGQLGALLLKLGLENTKIEEWAGEKRDEVWHLLWKLDCRVMDGKHAPTVGRVPPILRTELVVM